jgi:ubiquinone biosynthesis protein UbiJ
MSTTTVISPEAMSLLREGWALLVNQLGIQKATQFVMLLERGQGDSVEEIAQYWGDMSIEEIHHKVMIWKTQHQQKVSPHTKAPANN